MDVARWRTSAKCKKLVTLLLRLACVSFWDGIGTSEKLMQGKIDTFLSPVFMTFSEGTNPFIPLFWTILPELKVRTCHTQQSGCQRTLDCTLVLCIHNSFKHPKQFLGFLRIKQTNFAKNNSRQSRLRKYCQTFLASGLLLTKTAISFGRIVRLPSLPSDRRYSISLAISA